MKTSLIFFLFFSYQVFSFDINNIIYSPDTDDSRSIMLFNKILRNNVPGPFDDGPLEQIELLSNSLIIDYIKNDLSSELNFAENIFHHLTKKDDPLDIPIYIWQSATNTVTKGEHDSHFNTINLITLPLENFGQHSLNEFKAALFHELGHKVFEALLNSKIIKIDTDIQDNRQSYIIDRLNELFSDLFALGFYDLSDQLVMRSLPALFELHNREKLFYDPSVHHFFDPFRAFVYNISVQGYQNSFDHLPITPHLNLLNHFIQTINQFLSSEQVNALISTGKHSSVFQDRMNQLLMNFFLEK